MFLINDGNYIHLNMYAKVVKPERKFTEVNTIENDVKSYQVIKTIVNCT